MGPWLTNPQASHDVWTAWNFFLPCNTFWYRGDGLAGIFFRGGWLGISQQPVKTGWIFQN